MAVDDDDDGTPEETGKTRLAAVLAEEEEEGIPTADAVVEGTEILELAVLVTDIVLEVLAAEEGRGAIEEVRPTFCTVEIGVRKNKLLLLATGTAAVTRG